MEMEMDMIKMPSRNIPNDIIVEILFRLSIKSLLQLRWTCKYWFDLITRDPLFIIRMHLHHRATTTTAHDDEILRIISSSSYGGIRCSNVDYSKNCICSGTQGFHVSSEIRTTNISLMRPQILGFCNGLILINDLSIRNPFTKEYRLLPSPHAHPFPDLRPDLVPRNFGFNDFGFGYDHTSDDYKVIRNKYHNYVPHNKDDFNKYDVQVYTLRTDSWRTIGPNPYRLQSQGVYVNGALYWLEYPHHDNIVSFDLGKEEFQHVAKTSNLTNRDEDSRKVKLQVFEGCLCLVLKIKEEEEQNHYCMEMWVLMKDYSVNNEDDESFWIKLSTISNLPDFLFPIKPLRYTMNAEILMLTNQNDLVLYDPKNNKHKNLGRICGHSGESVKEVYSESLVSINSGTYLETYKEEDATYKEEDALIALKEREDALIALRKSLLQAMQKKR